MEKWNIGFIVEEGNISKQDLLATQIAPTASGAAFNYLVTPSINRIKKKRSVTEKLASFRPWVAAIIVNSAHLSDDTRF